MELKLTNIKDLYRRKEEFLEKEVTVGGWVRSIRGSKNFGFIVVNDGTFFEPLQVASTQPSPLFPSECASSNPGSCVH